MKTGGGRLHDLPRIGISMLDKKKQREKEKYHKLKGNMKRMLDSLKKFGFEEKPLYKNISTLRHNMMDGMAAWTKSPSDKRKDAAGAKKTAYEEAHSHF
jgi:U3 small nucleolar ribonucleoprotein component